MDFYVRGVYYYTEENINKYFTYIGETEIKNKIYCGEIGPKDDTRKYSVIPGLNNLVLFNDKFLTIDVDSGIKEFMLKGHSFTIPPQEFNLLIDSVCSVLLDQYSQTIIELSKKNYDLKSNMLRDITFPEKLIRLLEWNARKKKLKFDKSKFVEFVARFNIYFAYYGTNVGSEINKLRPVLIWKQHINKNDSKDNSYFVFPISSKKSKKNFNYHVELEIDGKVNYIRINDGRRISIKRIAKPFIDRSTNKTFKISQEKINEIKEAIRKYFSL